MSEPTNKLKRQTVVLVEGARLKVWDWSEIAVLTTFGLLEHG